jgi:hypothetical protein
MTRLGAISLSSIAVARIQSGTIPHDREIARFWVTQPVNAAFAIFLPGPARLTATIDLDNGDVSSDMPVPLVACALFQFPAAQVEVRSHYCRRECRV